MKGQFKKAPLVYVTARVRVSQFPDLTPEQHSLLQQALMKIGLVERHKGVAQLVGIPIVGESKEVQRSTIHRYAFMDRKKSKCLVLDGSIIEWRLTYYEKYQPFIEEFSTVLKVIVDVDEVFQHMVVEEFQLNYVDVIVPTEGYELKDYFEQSDRVLPLQSFFPDDKCLAQVGAIQISRIIKPDEKFDVTLEQLQIVDGKIPKFIPAQMTEPDNNLSMPLHLVREEWMSSKSDYYAILMTQAARLKEDNFGSMDVVAEFASLHDLTRETFEHLINRSVCNIAWVYEE